MTKSLSVRAQPLRLVLVEDSEDDARLIVRTLQQGGFDVTYERVETAADLQSLLDERKWDLVISDHGLPRFSAPEALALVRSRGVDVPFVIVSGSIGEDLAVAAMKAGASDYVLKGQLARLVPAVQRELGEAEQRRQRREVEDTLRQTERQLLQAQKMEAMGQLAGGIAHDFNNLLTAILGFSEFLLVSCPLDPAHRRDLEEIKRAGERAATLTRQLLAFSRQQVLEPRVVNLNEIVAGVQRLLARVIGEDVELVTEVEPELAQVKIDPGQLDQILMNLAVNARDAMPQGGRLTIRTSNCDVARNIVPSDLAVVVPAGQYVKVSVCDNGTGVPAEIKSRIFEPFFTTKEAGKGTGLGLATVYGIVKQSGGYISLESEPGRGTCFDIYLPSVHEAAWVAQADPAAAITRSSGESILLVDDEPAIRELLQRTLERGGFRVLVAAAGDEAWALAKTHVGAIHLLVTDVVMPRMGGAELATRLVEEHPALKVLYMSGYLDERVPQVAGERAAFLRKPFSPADLLRKAREILAADIDVGER